jgi:hypothetical protein
MNEARRTTPMGGYGVDIKLHHDRNNSQVYWSRRYNSFVICEDERGTWLFNGTTPVALYSINGIGEIRWGITPLEAKRTSSGGYYDADEGADAAEYFGLTPRNG